MRVHILDVNHHLKFQSIFDSFFDDNVWTDQDPDFIVSFEALIHGDRRIELTPGRELSDIYEYLETLTPSRTEWGTLLGVRPLKLVYRLFDQGWTEQQVREHLRQHLLLQPQKIELLLEVAAMNYRLKRLGINAAEEFSRRLDDVINAHEREDY